MGREILDTMMMMGNVTRNTDIQMALGVLSRIIMVDKILSPSEVFHGVLFLV